MARYKLLNGIKIQLTAEEEKARDTEETRNKAAIKLEMDAEANKETKKASGKQKLKDLGLDDDEIQALIGV